MARWRPSQTVLARVVNQVFKKQAEEQAAAAGKELDDETLRKQKLDGSKLPENYEVSIAPYFGPMGWGHGDSRGRLANYRLYHKKKGVDRGSPEDK